MTRKKNLIKKRHKKNTAKNGSITVYLCLTFCVILSLVLTLIASARYSAGRAALSCALDEGLFSLFSNYDKDLYEQYGLLFIDGGYGTDELNIGAMADETKEYLDEVLSPATGIFGTTPKELYRIDMQESAVTGYTLATDGDYAPLVEQICEIMSVKLGKDAIKEISGLVTENSNALDTYGFKSEDEIKELETTYEENKALADKYKEETKDLEGSESQEDTNAVEVPDDFVNPIDNITKLSKLGLMSFALPDGDTVSDASFDINNAVSKREKNSGMGLLPEETDGFDKKLMAGLFAKQFFSNYVSADDGVDGLKYQAEYIINGKAKDSANLKATMTWLCLLRTGLNYMYLMTAADKSAEIYQLALIISAVLLIPEAIELVAQIVRVIWAYAEAMMDVKSLLAGGKIPIYKDAASWQVSLSLFSTMNQSTQPDTTKRGLDYSEYLLILMYMISEDDLTARTADMIEYNIREEKGEAFKLDCCIYTFEIEFSGSISGQDITINRSYGYKKNE